MITLPPSSAPAATAHFRHYVGAAVLRIVRYVRELDRRANRDFDRTLDRFGFLRSYLADACAPWPEPLEWDAGVAWWEACIADGERAGCEPLPLARLARACGLDVRLRVGFTAVGLVEDDSRFGTLIAELQRPLGSRRPTLEFLAGLLADDLVEDRDCWDRCRSLVESGAVEVADRSLPRSEWCLQVPPELWDAAQARKPSAPWFRWVSREEFPSIAELDWVDTAVRERLTAAVTMGRAGELDVVLARGAEGGGRLDLLGSVARELGQDVVVVGGETVGADWSARVAPLCAMSGAMPVWMLDLGPGDTAPLPATDRFRSPIGVRIGTVGGVELQGAQRIMNIAVRIPDQVRRAALWRRSLGDAAPGRAALREITTRHRIGAGHIRTVGAQARVESQFRGTRRVKPADVVRAASELRQQLLDTLAHRLDRVDGDRIVLAPSTTARFESLVRRCELREQLTERVGGSNAGVRAVFHGPSGTGKTLAARVLASRLGMDVYRVNLAAIVDKYVGETEKRIHTVLDRAEQLDVVLLIDEGDALLGARTDVRSANERHLNFQTDVLLTRLADHEGVVVVTTNAPQLIDPAFDRRMDERIHFPTPGPRERAALWQLHIPGLDDDMIVRLTRCVLTGGQIRNAGRTAELLALDEQAASILDRHVLRAVELEFRKGGALSPLTFVDDVHSQRARRSARFAEYVRGARDGVDR